MFGKVTRVVAVVLLVATLIGVVPQSRAKAFLGPPVVAPPVTGLCVTPAAVILCMAAGVVVSGGLIWAADRIAGLTPKEDGTWDWCEYDGVVAAIKCLGDDAAPPLVTGDWTDLVPELEYPSGGSSNYRGLVWDEVNYLLPRSGYVEFSLQGGFDLMGAKVEPVLDGTTVIGQRVEYFARWNGLDGLGGPCPWVTVEELGDPPASWSDCTGLVRQTNPSWYPQGNMVSLHSSLCSNGAPERVESLYSGFGIIETVMCTGGGTWNLDAVTTNFWNATVDTVQNRMTFVASCHKAAGVWQPRFTNNQSNCGADNPSGRAWFVQTAWLTKAEPEMVQSVAVSDCRAVDGTITTRISSGEPRAFFEPEVAPAPSPCLPGEIPVETTISICPTEAELSECREVGTVAIPTIPDELDWECLYRLASDNPCSMWLEKWNGTEWEECVPDDNCVGWWEQPNRETHYRCGWGGTYFAASQCVPLRDFYDGPDGDVITHNPTAPNPDPTAGGDPVQIGGPVPIRSARPTDTWYQRVIREWATGSTADMMESCWPQGWGLLNPLQWVLRPTMCALAWAFVPQTALELRLERIMEEVEVRLGLSPSMLLFTLPTVGSACGWGFSSWEGDYLDVPQVNVIPCPSELGPTGPTWAGTSRALGYVVLGFGAWQLVHRWLTLRPHAGVDSEDGGVIV